jgi:hypothetical protein
VSGVAICYTVCHRGVEVVCVCVCIYVSVCACVYSCVCVAWYCDVVLLVISHHNTIFPSLQIPRLYDFIMHAAAVTRFSMFKVSRDGVWHGEARQGEGKPCHECY